MSYFIEHHFYILVPAAVENVIIENITTNSVLLIWQTPEGNRSSYELEVLGDSASVVSINSNDTSYLVDQLIPGNFYTFNVYAKAGNGLTGGIAENYTYTVPAAVENVIIENITTNSVLLIWQTPEGNRSSYELEVLGDSSSVVSLNSNDTSYLVDQLIPGNFYTFNIYAKGGNGLTGGIAENYTFTVPAAVENVIIENITTNSVLLIWQTPEGNRSSYELEVLGNSSSVVSLNSNDTSYLVDQLIPGNFYTFNIYAKGGNGLTGGIAENYTFTVPAAVENVIIENITTNSVLLIWQTPEGNRSSYELEVLGDSSSVVSLNSNDTSYLVDQLIPGNFYTFNIYAKAGNGLTGGIAENYTFTVPAAVENVIIEIITTNSVLLIWQTPEGNRSSYELEVLGDSSSVVSLNSNDTSYLVDQLIPGNFYTFNIYAKAGNGLTGGIAENYTFTVPAVIADVIIQNITTNSVLLSWPTPPGNRSSYELEVSGTPSQNMTLNYYETTVFLDHLVPGNFYIFTMFAKAGNGLSGNKTEKATYTPPGKVTILDVLKLNLSSLYLSWSPSEGNQSAYLVDVLGESSQWFTVTTESATITNLTTDIQYTVRISALAGENDLKLQGSSSDISVLLSDTLSATNITTNSLKLVWLPENIEQISYNITSFGIPSYNWSGASEEVLIESLIPGNLYTIQLSASQENNVLYGYGGRISVFTRPDIIRNVQFGNISTTSIDLSWNPPFGNHSNYIIEMTGDYLQNLTTESASIYNLTPGTQYTFKISAVAGENVPGDIYKLSVFTEPDVVQYLNISWISASSAFLSWTQPQGGHLFYQLDVTGPSTNNLTSYTEFLLVSDLIPGSQYNFSVYAVVGENRTQGKAVTVSGMTQPGVVRDIQLVNISSTSIQLTWLPPIGTHSYYKISVIGDIFQDLTTSSESLSIKDLTPGTYYTFVISAVEENTEGTTQEISTYTGKESLDCSFFHKTIYL
ncbi:receptor-type tyrosine- phosphatase eta-like isoform X1 [Pelobates cultripes]|uniref:Receptor-type tyrosine- phosphatase eta-like isoform X1 n=1 Tax=Pelobates cultripes TaxID=61616 RepID=A0AAD1TMK0_PELCU|nr:receptor-type tyrosine- phosphatase eta-like isoform X1 [Pelobates cultripes]